MFLFHFQKADLLHKRLFSVEIRCRKDLFYVLQRKLQFPVQKDLLQSGKRIVIVEPVAGPRMFCRLKKPDGIVVLQRPYTHAGQPADFVYR